MALFPSVFAANGVTRQPCGRFVSYNLHPVQYFPHQSQREQYPATRARRAFTCAAPALYMLAGGLLVVFGGYCAVSVTGGVTIAVGAYQHTPVSTAATRWRGNCAPAVLTLSVFQITLPLAGGLCTAPAVLAVSLRGVICARAGYRAPPWVTLHGLALCGIIPRANRRYIPTR